MPRARRSFTGLAATATIVLAGTGCGAAANQPINSSKDEPIIKDVRR